MVAVGELKIADDNIRGDVGDVAELAQSIKSVGVLEPLLVTTDKVVVAGARRLAAAKKAGLKEVPAIVRPFSEQERLEAMIVENLQREDLTPLEEASAFQRLAGLKLTQRQIAEKVGKSQAHVAKRLALLALPEKVRKQVDSGGIKLEEAQELAKVKDDPKLVERLASSKTGGPIGQKVQKELDRRVREAKREKAKAAALKKGVSVVEAKLDEWGYGVSLPKGFKRVSLTHYDGIRLEPASHAKLDCHAVAIDHNGQQFAVCTKPDSHPDPMDDLKKKREKEDAQRKKAMDAMKAMNERRREQLAKLIAGKVDKDVALELAHVAVAHGIGHYSYGHEEELALDLLGVERHLDDDENPDAYVVLGERAKKSAVDKVRVTMALCAAVMEDELSTSTGWTRSNGDVPAYFAVLERMGYVKQPEEVKFLAGD